MSKKLVAYFSHKGENYSKGKIINLEKGNTEVVAEMISKIIDVDIFEIVAEKNYPIKYNDCIEVAKKDLRENSRPKLKEDIDIKEYDIIFLGYPNWWGTMPMPVWTFLESKDLNNKKILPFCTLEGSGLAGTDDLIADYTKGKVVKNTFSIRGKRVENSKNKVEIDVKKL